jgi:hypothetical protein
MELHNDDKPVGRVLSRREMIALLGGSGVAALVGMSLPRLVSAQRKAPQQPLPRQRSQAASCARN